MQRSLFFAARATGIAIAGFAFAVPAPPAAAKPRAAESRPAEPSGQRLADAEKCAWEWRSSGGVGVWAQRCRFATGEWALQSDPSLPGFAQTVDGADPVTVLQVFSWPPEQGLEGLKSELLQSGAIPYADCALRPIEGRPTIKGRSYLELRPVGERLTAFNATPQGEIPEPPCGSYGWSTHGVRYFVIEQSHQGKALFVDIGQDGMMFDETTARLE